MTSSPSSDLPTFDREELLEAHRLLLDDERAAYYTDRVLAGRSVDLATFDPRLELPPITLLLLSLLSPETHERVKKHLRALSDVERALWNEDRNILDASLRDGRTSDVDD